MNKLFIHHPIFRLFSPLFSGSLVYLLILLVNNDVAQLDDEFLGQELYICIGLSYLIQEFSRLLLIIFSRNRWSFSFLLRVTIQVLIAICFTFLTVSILLYGYYQYFLGFAPSFSELLMFNVIFSMISIIYVSLYLSHQLLYQINTSKISSEIELKNEVEEDYRQFVRGINPDLLFEGLEALIIQMKLVRQNKELYDPDELLDVLSMVYRYMLSNKSKELVQFDSEQEALRNLISLYDFLPYSKVKLVIGVENPGMVVPGTLLHLVQELIRMTIPSHLLEQEIELTEDKSKLILQTIKNDKVSQKFSLKLSEALNQRYSHYSNQQITIDETDEKRTIYIPKISINS